MGVGALAVGIGAALQQGTLRAAKRQVDIALRLGRQAVAHGAVIPLEVVGMEQGHAAGVDKAGLGYGHDAGGAAVQPVHGVEAVALQVVGHSSCDGGGLLRQGGGVDGDARGLVQKQQVLVLVEDGQRVVHRQDVGILPGLVRHIGLQDIAGVEQVIHRDGRTVDGNGAAEFQTAQQAAGDVPQAAQQFLGGAAGLRGDDGMGQDAHGGTSFR